MSITSYSFEMLVKRCFRLAGLEVQRLRGANTDDAIVKNLLEIVRPSALLDVGANAGQYASLVRSLGYRGSIISFEPLSDAHAQLQDRARSDKNWTIAPRMALGEVQKEVQINVSRSSASSSLLPMLATHVAAAPESIYTGVETVQMMRLDNLMNIFPGEGRLFLKLDTQGYDLEVLRGATGIMNRVAAVQVEISLVPLYERAPTLVELVGHIESLGYEIFNIAPGFKDKRTGRLLQADGFFVRAGLTV